MSTPTSETPDKAARYEELLRRSLRELKRLEQEVEALRAGRQEPIAIVGMGCRLPAGASDPDALWDALCAGADGVREVPAERWDVERFGSAAGTRWGGFLDGVDGFDADFFGISPREAESMDPQQRLLLEVCWEALESGGQRPRRLAGSKTGVFVGVMGSDYLYHLLGARGVDGLDVYATTGNGHSFPAGRISYQLGLQGPSLVIDTACSSSLVAVDMACRSLRARQCELAIAGGVNLMLAPYVVQLMAKTHALSPDGRCRAFDAFANGYVRAEGCGAVVLKRQSDAVRDGDRILALVAGSAVNQDGRSTAIAAPNVLAQEALLRSALADARMEPGDVGYVETHGTGTPLGDPIEFEALRRVYGNGRATPCVLGALKTNMGHLEAAAGIAGLIKAVLCLQHGSIPRNLNYLRPNPHLGLESTPFLIPTESRPWPARGPRAAAVSSFGLSGTNAHVVLRQAPAEVAANPPASDVRGATWPALCVLSSHRPELIAEQARRLLPHARDVCGVAATLARRRDHHAHRAALVAGDGAELEHRLRQLASEARDGQALPSRGRRTVFVFSGHGGHWAGMGRALIEQEPIFREALARCDAALTALGEPSVLSILERGELGDGSTASVQPLVFCLQVALARLWQALGVSPDAVVGHSMGEIAAAHVSGALSLDQAALVMLQRSRLLREATQGGVALLGLDERASAAAIEPFAGLVVASFNGPRSTVVSGPVDALEQCIERVTAAGHFARRMQVEVCAHGGGMAPLARALGENLSSLTPARARVPFYSSVRGCRLAGSELDAGYFADNFAQPVRFLHAMRSLLSDEAERGCGCIEIGPHPVLGSSLRDLLAERGAGGVVVVSLQRERNPQRTLVESLGALWQAGCAVDLDHSLAVPSGPLRTLPARAFLRARHWIDGDAGALLERAGAAGPAGVTRQAPTIPQARAQAPEASSLEGVEDAALQAALESMLRAHVAMVCHRRPAEIDLTASLRDLGLDSLVLAEFKHRLETATDLQIPIAAFVTNPSVAALGGDLARALVARRALVRLRERPASPDEQEVQP